MKAVVSTDTMRKSDAAAIAGGVSAKELMGRAAAAVAEKGFFRSPVAIICGSGNNGGDGYALAPLLKNKGLDVKVFFLSPPVSEESGGYAKACREADIPLIPYQEGTELSSFATVVDCILGTGFSGPVRSLAADAIRQINASGAKVISVDISSGLSGDSGLGEVAVKADQTITIGGLKPGLFLGRAKDLRGEWTLADIGIPLLHTDAWLMEEKDAASCLPERRHYAHKGTYGYVALAGGSPSYSGAPRLSVMAAAAARSGAGVVAAAVPKTIMPLMAPHLLEETIFPLSVTPDGETAFKEEEWEALCARFRVIAFGMGMGRTEHVQKALSYLIDHFEGDLVIDADGLNALARTGLEKLRQCKAKVILTPHLGEAAGLLGRSARDLEEAPLFFAGEMARAGGCTVLLKGPSTVVTDGKESWIVDKGAPGMATAGSGDVLSGVLAAILSYGRGSLPKKGAAAAAICGMAGERAQEEMGAISMLAGDTVRHIPAVMGRLEVIRNHMTV